MKVIHLSYTHNTRDIGGMLANCNYKIKENKLIRSGSLHRLSSKDIETLASLNIKVVIDFRSESDFINKPDIRLENVTYLSFPALPKEEKEKINKRADSNLLDLVNKETGGKILLMNTYKNMFITKEGILAYKNFFKVLKENEDGAILWHCSQGKDRAGLAAYLLQYVLGVSKEDRDKDYMFTNEAMKLKIKQLTPIVLKQSGNDKTLLKNLKDVFSADMDYLNEALKTIDEYYGNIDFFLKNVLEVDYDALKEKYLEKQ